MCIDEEDPSGTKYQIFVTRVDGIDPDKFDDIRRIKTPTELIEVVKYLHDCEPVVGHCKFFYEEQVDYKLLKGQLV
jgi:hypothetical protein